MQEMGISADIFPNLLDGSKTVEARLRTPKFVTLRTGDKISFREDVWHNDRLTSSQSNKAHAVITKTTFFDSFSELFDVIDYKSLIPNARDKASALAIYKKHYTDQQEAEHGIVAIRFKIV